MVAEKNRPDGEKWTPLGNWRNFLASLISTFTLGVPWLAVLWLKRKLWDTRS